MTPEPMPLTHAQEVRISDDEPVRRVAQLIPGFPKVDQHERWLCMTAPDGLLTANLLHDDDVADWRVLWPAAD